MAARVAVYMLRIMGPGSEEGLAGLPADPEEREEMHVALNAALSQAEAEISEQLPEGYYAKIEDA